MRVNNRHQLAWHESEALLYDIPVFINAIIASSCISENNAMITYQVNADSADIISFYQYEMERLGWQQYIDIEAEEVAMVFQKPSSICSISIRPEKSGIKVVILLKRLGPVHSNSNLNDENLNECY